MSKQKGRGGKKQRYSIADIGGGDLTSQDVSTEKVLNFLIRGGISDVEGSDNSGEAPPEELTSVGERSRSSEGDVEASKADSPYIPRRSLDHLFNRAGRGDANKEPNSPESKEIPAVPQTDETLEVQSLGVIDVPRALTALSPDVSDLSEITPPDLSHFPTPESGDNPTEIRLAAAGVPETVSSTTEAAPFTEAETAPPAVHTPPALATHLASVDDTQLLERWKKKHRLSKGELKVLRVMLGLCREGGCDTCFIKIPHLMEAAELKERQTQLVLKSLRELGLIDKLADYSNVDRRGTQYRIIFEAEQL